MGKGFYVADLKIDTAEVWGGVTMLCPAVVPLHMPLRKYSRPRWKLRVHRDGTATLMPCHLFGVSAAKVTFT